jgi:MFS superfamily sulfate permease-like transporter
MSNRAGNGQQNTLGAANRPSSGELQQRGWPRLSWDTFKSDLLSSIVVFLVALPLCMGIAIASGVPVVAGLITGMVGGIVVGLLAGAPLQVSGPAAGLTVIVFGIVQQHGQAVLSMAVLLAGLMQIAAGLGKLGQWFRAVSPAVIKGMLAGIGVLILGSQFHVMVDDKPRKDGLRNLLAIPEAVYKGLPVSPLGSREDRTYRTRVLREVGSLHEDQRELLTEVAATVTHERSAQGQQLNEERLLRLVEWQQTIVDHLTRIVAEMDQRPLVLEAGRNGANVREVAQRALDAAREALADLKHGGGGLVEVAIAGPRIELEVKAVTTQRAAEQALGQLRDSLKNHDWAAKVGFLTIATIVLWQLFAPQRLKIIPAPLVAAVLATACAALLALPILYVEVPENLLHGVQTPHWATLGELPWGAVLQSALVLAAVASAETLLCATAVDKMHSGPRTNYDRELAAQGVGNTICGFLGALPMTGVIVRSAANVQAGAKTRLSTILHGLWLLLFVAALPFVLQLIPVSCLAGILVYTGYKLVNIKTIKELYAYGRGEVFIYLATMIMIVVTDLLTGVIVGIALASIKLLYTFSHLQVNIEQRLQQNLTIMRLQGAATFIRLPRLAAALERVAPGAELHVDFQHLEYIDHACLDLLLDWAKQHEATGGRLVIDWDMLHASFRREAARDNGTDSPPAEAQSAGSAREPATETVSAGTTKSDGS